jgi:hypothetical protein
MTTNLPTIVQGEIEGADKGRVVSSEAIKILNMLKSFGADSVQQECNKVLIEHRNRWILMPPDANVDELGFPFTYRNALRELERPFVLSTPNSIHVEVLNSRSPKNPLTGAATVIINNDFRNPIIRIYLYALEISYSMIIWTGFQETFCSEHFPSHIDLLSDGDFEYSSSNEGLDGYMN